MTDLKGFIPLWSASTRSSEALKKRAFWRALRSWMTLSTYGRPSRLKWATWEGQLGGGFSHEVLNIKILLYAEEHSLLATSIGLIVGLVGVEVFSSEEWAQLAALDVMIQLTPEPVITAWIEPRIDASNGSHRCKNLMYFHVIYSELANRWEDADIK